MTTCTVRTGGREESSSEVSPCEISSQRLCTFFVPGLTPHVANESEGKRGLSHSERDCGDAKLWRRLMVLLGFEGDGDEVAEWDMAGILRKRRGLRGKERKGQVVVVWDLVEVKRKQTERAVRKRSGKEGRDCPTRLFSGGGDISTSVVVFRVQRVVVLMTILMGLKWGSGCCGGGDGEVHGIGGISNSNELKTEGFYGKSQRERNKRCEMGWSWIWKEIFGFWLACIHSLLFFLFLLHSGLGGLGLGLGVLSFFIH